MASEIRIKRSGVTAAPTALKSGELAYSWVSNQLYFGRGDDGSGNATSIVDIGGEFYTDMLDHTAGTLTASSAVIVDADSKVNVFNVDDLRLDGSTLSTTNTNGNLTLSPNGSGLVSIAGAYTLPRVDGSAGYVLTTNGTGTVSWQASSSILSVAADSGSNEEINLLTETLDIAGSGAISTATATNSVVISVATATDTVLGVASFNSTDFVVNSGAVSLSTEAIQDIIGGMVDGNSESGISVEYNDTTGKLNFDVADFTLTIDGDVDGSASVTNLGNTTVTVTLDTVNSNVGTFGSATAVPVITVNAKGLVTAVTTESISTSFTVAGETGSNTFANGSTLTFAAGEGIDTVVTQPSGSNVTVTISGEDASTSNKGIASFETADFNVTSGDVELKDTVVKSIAGGTGTATPTGHSFTITGTAPISTSATGSTVTIAAADASTTDKGVASFSADNFAVASGVVTIKDGGIANAELVNSSLTVGTTTISLGGSSTSLAGLTELTVDNLNFNGNEISSTDSNGNISLNPNGTGTVDVNGARITTVATPTATTDAATKGYVDQVAQGIAAKPAVEAATTANLVATYANGTLGVGATLTSTTDGAFPTIGGWDGGTEGWKLNDGILVKNQTNPAHNGRYFISTVGDGSTPWVLTRCGLCDEKNEIPSAFVFVQHGTLYGNTGWVASVDNVSEFTVGTDDIDWIQFSGAGTYTAGAALSLNGTEFNVNVATNGGIEIDTDALQIKSTVAGDGLTWTSTGGGFLSVVGTADRISVSADAVDIASTYAGQSSITTLGTITTGTWNGTTLAVTHGGTGLTSVTARAVVYGNGTAAMGVTGVSAIDGSFLREDSTGNPYWSNVIDGGTF
jgi:hypothetical protein